MDSSDAPESPPPQLPGCRRALPRAIATIALALALGAALGIVGYHSYVGSTVDGSHANDNARQIEQNQGIAKVLTANYIDGINSGNLESLKSFTSATAYSDVVHPNNGNVHSMIIAKGPAVINHYEPMVIGADSIGGIISLMFGTGAAPEHWQFAYFQCSRTNESWQLDGMWLLVKP